jgi:hypothetical protein
MGDLLKDYAKLVAAVWCLPGKIGKTVHYTGKW